MRKAMTIAGSDSGGGAGIQADLKTFAALGVYGTSAITALTAQNTLGVQGVFPVEPAFVGQQIDSIMGTSARTPPKRVCCSAKRLSAWWRSECDAGISATWWSIP
jgi:hypothetical protein